MRDVPMAVGVRCWGCRRERYAGVGAVEAGWPGERASARRPSPQPSCRSPFPGVQTRKVHEQSTRFHSRPFIVESPMGVYARGSNCRFCIT